MFLRLAFNNPCIPFHELEVEGELSENWGLLASDTKVIPIESIPEMVNKVRLFVARETERIARMKSLPIPEIG